MHGIWITEHNVKRRFGYLVMFSLLLLACNITSSNIVDSISGQVKAEDLVACIEEGGSSEECIDQVAIGPGEATDLREFLKCLGPDPDDEALFGDETCVNSLEKDLRNESLPDSIVKDTDPIEEDPSPAGSLEILQTSGSPENCTILWEGGEHTGGSMLLTCDIRLETEVLWEFNVNQGYVHCRALTAHGEESSFALSGSEGIMVVEILARQIGDIFPDENHDFIPDRPPKEVQLSRTIQFECSLTESYEFNLDSSSIDTLGFVRCLDPEYHDASAPDFCKAAQVSLDGAWLGAVAEE
jgi:hypothetical protein